MSDFIRRVLKVLAYASAAAVVLLAILLALFRLLLPRLPEHQDELKAWASEAIGLEVEFAGMDARWGLRGPELSFYDAELIRPGSGARLIAAGEVGIIVSLPELLFEQHLLVDTVRVRDSSVELRRDAAGNWTFQGETLARLGPGDAKIDALTVIGEDLRLLLVREGDPRPTRFDVPRVLVQRDLQRTAVDADVRLPESLGTLLTVAASQLATGEGAREPWNVTVSASLLELPGWSALAADPARRVTGGRGALDASFVLAGTEVRNVSATGDLAGVSLNGGPPFDVSGRFAFSREPGGWLAALDELRLSTANGEWPLCSLRVEAGRGPGERQPRSAEVQASYVDFADAAIVAGWLGETPRRWLDTWQPDGVVENLVLSVADLAAAESSYAVSAELSRVGLAAQDVAGIRGIGIRGFSGSLRADPEGGLLAIDAGGVTLDLSQWVPEPVELDRMAGTVVWRRSGDRLTILSDNISLANAVLDSRSNVEITIDGDAGPVIDLASDWRIADVAVAKRFIPRRLMTAKLYDWFQDSLLAGRVADGTAHLRGPLEAFPFDGGEGRLLVEARIEDLEFRYHPQFPVVDVAYMRAVLDNTRLYTRENRSVTTGNATENAIVEIPDLRRPVLTVAATSRGTLESLHAFASASPLARVFGGHLDKVSVAGDGTLALDLEVPLRAWRDFAVTAEVSGTDATLAIDGLDAPFTGLAGTVTVSRDHIESRDLAAHFLGAPVTIEVSDAPAGQPGYKVVAAVRGAATATALVDELGLPLEGRLHGRADFTAEVRFPRGDHEPRAPFDVQVSSSLAGLGIELPAPLAKPAPELRRFVGDLVFAPGADRITTAGSLGDAVAWAIDFAPAGNRWDFDRGMLTLGGAAPAAPDVRGLHVRGNVERLDLAEWFAVTAPLRDGHGAGSGGDGGETGAGDRVRSVDILVGELEVAGQRLFDHRVQVDRSARDWLVQLEGDEVAGSIFVPYDFSPAATLVLDMERFILPGDGEEEPSLEARPPAVRDPRTLPSIAFRAGEFGVGERRFGSVTADITQTGEGLVSDSLSAADASFRIAGRAQWLADEGDPSGSSSRAALTLSSTDVDATMRRLGYEPGIASEEMNLDFDLRWSGGPRAGFLTTLHGDVEVRLGAGQLNEVEPGAGRMFGLLSVAALPRRLALDFRDVFQKGFSFDEISGTFRLEDGTAYTCDLSLVGPAADIGITGQADLVAGDYSQAAVVSANLGNTLPVVGAIAAGPQVAAALFLFSQVFRKPLKEVGQVYYSMSGSWDSPVVDSTDAEAFAATAARAGCLAQVQAD
ncbi:MAG TPA: YhdP family protein [Woeseiaceae bacterium]|nr:YhdP family protein [Woeseiaceae bacterium]